MTISSIGKEHEPNNAGYRQRYDYVITANGWEYVGNDIHSGFGADVDLDDAALTLFGLLGACGEARSQGYNDSDSWGLFPDHVAQWAVQASDEIVALAKE